MKTKPTATRKTPKKQITPQDWKQTFLDSLRENPLVSEACKAANVSRATAYRVRQSDVVFAADWERALKIGMSVLIDAAHKRALDGSDTLMIFLLKAHDPEKYGDRMRMKLDVNLKELTDQQLADLAEGKAI